MDDNAIEMHVIEMDKFAPNTAEPGELLSIYRRLADIYDPTAVAVRNANGDFIGYLDREIAQVAVLPGIKQGLKYECIVLGEGEEPNSLSIQIRSYEPAPVPTDELAAEEILDSSEE